MKSKRLIQKLSMSILGLSLALGIVSTNASAETGAFHPSLHTQTPGAYHPAQKVDPGQLVHKTNKLAMKKTGGANVLGPTNPKYKMAVSYDKDKHTVTGQLKVTFKNNVGKKLNKLYFNLWGNADMFKENGGSMTASHIKVNGKDADYGIDGTKLRITGLSLKNNKKATVNMEFKVTLPNQQDRFGWYDQTVSLGNWFPILGVYDDEGWNVDPYFPYGESFYSVTGDFDVTLATDRSEVVATTGTEQGKPQVIGNIAVHHYKAKNVRDFAMEMDPGYHVKHTKVGNVKVNVYYTDKQAKYADAMLEAGHDSVKLFNKKFGKYPWPELDIASMEGWFGGMEYPQLVMISLAGTPSQAGTKSTTAHEIGHQWFYGVVGDNEYDEPWLDESFASFAAALYSGRLDQLTSPPVENKIFHLSSPVSTFTNHADEGGINAYYSMIYDYGSRTLNDLRLTLGDKTFYKAMHDYYQKKKFGISTTKDFIKIMEQSSGQNLKPFFKSHRVFVSDQK